MSISQESYIKSPIPRLVYLKTGLFWINQKKHWEGLINISLSDDDFQLWRYLWLQRDAIDTLALALVCHVCVNLSGFHVLVSEHVLDGVDTRTGINLQGTESMTGTMEIQ